MNGRQGKVKLSLSMKVYGGVDVWIHIFLTSALAEGGWSASRPGRFAPRNHWIGGWVDPRAGLDDMEKWKFLTPPGLELRPLGRQASSQSLYRLRYPGLPLNGRTILKWGPIINSIRIWTYALDRAQGQVPVNAVLNLQVPQKDEDFLTEGLWTSDGPHFIQLYLQA
jgi:hypothetical protein